MPSDFSSSVLHQRCPSGGWDMRRHVAQQERDVGRLRAATVAARWRRIAGEQDDGNAGKKDKLGYR